MVRFSTVFGSRFVSRFILVLPEDIVMLVVMVVVLPRPPGLARCLGLSSWEYDDVLGTWDDGYLKDTFNL